MISTYERLHEIVSPKLKAYRTDLEKHDRNQLAGYDGPFIYGYRPTGTSLLKTGLRLEDWFGGEMVYKAPFCQPEPIRDVDHACQILEEQLVWLNPGADNKWFLHFDGKIFHEVTKDRVGLIWRNYVHSLKMSAPFKMELSKAITI